MFFLMKLVKFYLLKHLPLPGPASRLLLQPQPQPQPDFLLLLFDSLRDAVVNSLQKTKKQKLTNSLLTMSVMPACSEAGGS